MTHTQPVEKCVISASDGVASKLIVSLVRHQIRRAGVYAVSSLKFAKGMRACDAALDATTYIVGESETHTHAKESGRHGVVAAPAGARCLLQFRSRLRPTGIRESLFS